MNKSLLFILLAASLMLTADAAPLASATAVHTRPDVSSPTITFLKAGTEPGPLSQQPAAHGHFLLDFHCSTANDRGDA